MLNFWKGCIHFLFACFYVLTVLMYCSLRCGCMYTVLPFSVINIIKCTLRSLQSLSCRNYTRHNRLSASFMLLSPSQSGLIRCAAIFSSVRCVNDVITASAYEYTPLGLFSSRCGALNNYQSGWLFGSPQRFYACSRLTTGCAEKTA